MNFMNKIKNLIKDKYFIIFFFGSIAASIIVFFVLDSIRHNNIYSRNGYIMFREYIPWMLILILYSPAYILSRLFPFLGDVVDFAFLVVQGFIYGFIGLYIKNMILARRIQKEQNVFSPESKIPASKNKKFGIILVYYTIILAIIYIATFLFRELLGPLILLVIGYSVHAWFMGLFISIIGIFKDDKKILSVIMFILYGIMLTLMQYVFFPIFSG
ncbi:MAG: hypothetical protein AAB397_03195 [Patescibacteria group bacterium]